MFFYNLSIKEVKGKYDVSKESCVYTVKKDLSKSKKAKLMKNISSEITKVMKDKLFFDFYVNASKKTEIYIFAYEKKTYSIDDLEEFQDILFSQLKKKEIFGQKIDEKSEIALENPEWFTGVKYRFSKIGL